MQALKLALRVSCAATIAGGTGVVWAQDFPNHPLRIVTPGTGGGGDVAARLIAPGMTAALGQPVVVDNRPSGVIPGSIVAKAAPDGHTLLMTSSSHWLAQFMQDGVPYDAARDFSPITLVVNAPTILVVHPSLAATSVKELIALAKARQGALNYASIASGSPTHLAAELFKSMAGVNIVRVPYKASGAALTDLIGGQVQLMFAVVTAVTPHVKSGRLRALAITSAQPSALAPGLPTVAAAGLPGYQAVGMFGLFAPAATPAAVVNRLNREIVTVLQQPDIKEKFFSVGVETVGSTPAQFGAAVKAEMTTMGKLIKDVGIRAD